MHKKLLIPLFLVLGTAVQANGISVFPKEAVLSARDRGASVTLVNATDTDAMVRLSLRDLVMEESGKLKTVEEGEYPWAAQEMIRYSPRQVVIPAGGKQIVRLMFRRNAGIAEGEYRSHLTVHTLPDKNPKRPEDKQSGINLDIRMISGFSIPVYVRVGELQSSVSTVSAKVLKRAELGNKGSVELSMAHSGNSRAYVKLEVYGYSKSRDDQGVVGQLLGVAKKVKIYRETKLKKVQIAIDPIPASADSLLVVITDLSQDVPVVQQLVPL
jgi:fimbrial chaperone protein